MGKNQGYINCKVFSNSKLSPKLEYKYLPIESVAIYVPGSKASYPSTVLMNAIPARVAGVERVVMASPGGTDGKINQTVLAAAHIAGIKEIHMPTNSSITIDL